MLFPTAQFIFVFLPLALLAFFAAGRLGGGLPAKITLTLLSLVFYGFGEAWFVWVLVGSMVLNFAVGRWISGADNPRLQSTVLALGVAANLALIGIFKYSGFASENLRWFGFDLTLPSLALPLGISFYTFQQIAYLVDLKRGREQQPSFWSYATFMTFFPALIAGPIVYLREFAGQANARFFAQPIASNIAVGLAIFAIGLFKKIVVADNLAVVANGSFDVTDAGVQIGFAAGWLGTLAYSLQLYFDFSGYSDMAIGLARMMNIRLPENFRSPYKARSIIDFWRRWHITLSRFLREYLYFSLGGNRKGPIRRQVNLMLTMLLGGLWHGAGWNFVIWGGLHGAYLVLNHTWQSSGLAGRLPTGLAWILTALAVALAWVFFRASTVEGAMAMLSSLVGFGETGRVSFSVADVRFVFLALIAVAVLPNTQEIMRRYRPVLEHVKMGGWARRIAWRPNLAGAAFVGALLVASIMHLTRVSEFIYFRF